MILAWASPFNLHDQGYEKYELCEKNNITLYVCLVLILLNHKSSTT